MNQCQQCGQPNSLNSNFCRFCGGKMIFPHSQNQYPPPPQQQPISYEYNPPRPYSWKTDEFQVKETQPRNPRNAAPTPPLNAYQTNQSQQQMVYQQPRHLANSFHCPRCSSNILPSYTRKISTAGWIVFAVLLVTFFPLFWIGLLIKEDVMICPVCQTQINGR